MFMVCGSHMCSAAATLFAHSSSPNCDLDGELYTLKILTDMPDMQAQQQDTSGWAYSYRQLAGLAAEAGAEDVGRLQQESHMWLDHNTTLSKLLS